MDRILGLVDSPPKHVRRPRPKAKDTNSQSRDKSRDTAKHQGIINRLANRITQSGAALKQADWALSPDTKFRRYEAVLKAIFYTLFVPRSVELGLIDLDNLYLTGDSTKLGTYANPHGKRLCSCPKEKPCSCPRRYQDHLAQKVRPFRRGLLPKSPLDDGVHLRLPFDSLRHRIESWIRGHAGRAPSVGWPHT